MSFLIIFGTLSFPITVCLPQTACRMMMSIGTAGFAQLTRVFNTQITLRATCVGNDDICKLRPTRLLTNAASPFNDVKHRVSTSFNRCRHTTDKVACRIKTRLERKLQISAYYLVVYNISNNKDSLCDYYAYSL